MAELFEGLGVHSGHLQGNRVPSSLSVSQTHTRLVPLVATSVHRVLSARRPRYSLDGAARNAVAVNRSSVAHILEKLQAFLQSDGALLLPQPYRDDCLHKTRSLLEKAREPGEVLYVGILGGTGVGKSTLINALAREKISDPSDRRPFTDRAVAYRHSDTPRGLEKVSHLLREDDAVHSSDTIRDLILLDLPDFDSRDEKNRSTVMEILPMLDAVVWVVSPEKYADAVFYEMVRQTAMHRENFTFVLNKADELLGDENRAPHARLMEVLGDFTFRLKHEAGVEEPRTFSLSAVAEFHGTRTEPVLEEEFSRFRQFLMVRRDAKEIASVKTVNLVEETRRLVNGLIEHIRPDDTARILDSIGEIQFRGPDADLRSGLKSAEQENKLADALLPVLRDADASIWPVKGAMRLLTLAHRSHAAKTPADRLEDIFQATAEALARDRRVDLERIAARMDSELLLAFQQPAASGETNRPEAVIAGAIEEASSSFAEKVENRKAAMGGKFSRWRRFRQKFVLCLPVPILVLKLARPEIVEAWLNQPTVSGAVKMALGFLTALFGWEGLIALVALLIFQVILACFLAARRIRKIEKDARRLARYAVNRLDESLDVAERRVQESRKNEIQRIRQGIDRLNAIRKSFAAG